MLQELERLPDIILLPSEGHSSIYVADWAESLHIKTQVFQSDWARNGKVAQRIRDERIQKECTHALIYLSNRSDRLEKYAESLAKKGKIVFTSSSNQTLQMLTCSEPVKKASTSARKSSKEKVQMLLKFQTTE
jgi:thymidylate kinase